jgi:hypothetical protein
MINVNKFLLLFIIPFISFSQQCDYTLYIYDSYGDGWKGNQLTIYVNGTSIGYVAVPTDASSANYTLTFSDGDIITGSWTEGLFSSEVSGDFYDSNGDLVQSFVFGTSIYFAVDCGFFNSGGDCADCVALGGFYCGDDESNWTIFSPDGCVPDYYLNDSYDDCLDGSDENGALPTTIADCNSNDGCVFEASDGSGINYFDIGDIMYWGNFNGQILDSGCSFSYCLGNNNYTDPETDTSMGCGCMDPNSCNYEPDAIYAGFCEDDIVGCTNAEAENYNPEACLDDGSCVIYGCTDPEADNYNPMATNNDQSCVYTTYGCTDASACNYDADATEDLGGSLCIYPEEYYDCQGVCINDFDFDNICDELEVYGCTDSEADNFNWSATEDDGSCIYTIYGCTNSIACNYDPMATEDFAGSLCDYPGDNCELDNGTQGVFSDTCECIEEDTSFITEETHLKKVIQVIDILGKTTNTKGFRLIIYDDGVIDKKYLIK